MIEIRTDISVSSLNKDTTNTSSSNTTSIGTSSNTSETTTVKTTSNFGTVYLSNEIGTSIYDVLDKVNSYLKKYKIELGIYTHEMDNNYREFLKITSDTTVEYATGISSLVLTKPEWDFVILLTLDTFKVLVNKTIPELEFNLLGKIKTKLSDIFITTSKKMKTFDKKYTSLLERIDTITMQKQYLKNPVDRLTTAITMIRNEDFKKEDVELAVSALKNTIILYNTLNKRYKELKRIDIVLDIHLGNVKQTINAKGEIKLIYIDPFIVFIDDVNDRIKFRKSLTKYIK